jgi:hypothetical protein
MGRFCLVISDTSTIMVPGMGGCDFLYKLVGAAAGVGGEGSRMIWWGGVGISGSIVESAGDCMLLVS